jgi:hypothetical protein
VFRIEIPTAYAVLVRRPHSRAISAFSRDSAATNIRSLARKNIAGIFSERFTVRFAFYPTARYLFPAIVLNPWPSPPSFCDASVPFSARGIAIHARFNWQNEFQRASIVTTSERYKAAFGA